MRLKSYFSGPVEAMELAHQEPPAPDRDDALVSEAARALRATA